MSIGLRLPYKLILPSEYQEIEYLEGTGTQYINTNFTNTSYTELHITCDFEINTITKQQILFGYQATSSNPYKQMVVATNANTTQLKGYFGESLNLSMGSFVQNAKNRLDFVVNSTTQTYSGTINGTSFNGAFGGTLDSDNPLFLFSQSYSTSIPYNISQAKIYNFKITNNDDTIIRDLIPAKRKSDSVLGMYDTANNIFYPNAGSGTFTAGPVKNNLRLMYKVENNTKKLRLLYTI